MVLILTVILVACSNAMKSSDRKMAGEESKIVLSTDREGSITSTLPYFGRSIHAMIISQDLNVFAHIHPEDFNNGKDSEEMIRAGLYPVYFKFPFAGEYLVGVTALSKEGVWEKVFRIKAEGSPEMSNTNYDFSREKRCRG